MMKRHVKQKIKHKIKLYLTHVSVRQMKEQHNETKRSVKRRKKEIRNNHQFLVKIRSSYLCGSNEHNLVSNGTVLTEKSHI